MTCKYFTIVKSNLQKYLLSKKHLDLQDTPEVVGKTIISYQCKVCDKCYKSHSGSWKHSLMCKVPEVVASVPEIVSHDLHSKIESHCEYGKKSTVMYHDK